MRTLEYTQFTKAWPRLSLNDSSVYEEINVLAEDDNDISEFNIRFYRWDGRSQGVRFEVFGDGMPAFYDYRIQELVRRWRALPVPDDATPQEIISLLEGVGVKPSKYQLRAE